MSYQKHPHPTQTIWETFKRMRIESQEIVANLVVCGLIFASMAEYGSSPTFSVAAMAFVQSVHLPRMIRAYREAKYQLPNQQTNDS